MNVSEFKCFIGVFVQILFTIIFHFKFYFIVRTISFMIRVGDWLWRVYLFKSDFYFEWNTGRYIVWEHIGFQYPSYFVSLTIFFKKIFGIASGMVELVPTGISYIWYRNILESTHGPLQIQREYSIITLCALIVKMLSVWNLF